MTGYDKDSSSTARSSQQKGSTHEIKATVQRVLPGKHGMFVVATAPNVYGSITFSLSSDVWVEDGQPEPGEVVILGDLRQKRAGWRAHTARYARMTD